MTDFLKLQKMDNDPENKEVENITTNMECIVKEMEPSDISSDTGSEISLSEKIVLESNEKRLRQRMTSLQTSIMNLKEQLKLEKELWREDLEKIRILQQQQQDNIKCNCLHKTVSRDTLKYEIINSINSNCSLGSGEGSKRFEDVLRTYSIKQLLELQNYKRKLAETENMCNIELSKVKQSLEDLKALQSIASVWGRNEEKAPNSENFEKVGDTKSLEEIYVHRIEKCNNL